ncbi:molecular chaperone SurA, partial [Streptococcus danieliae]|nr:molecular chaperone SurA [Streptococcus danieliae]
MRNASMHQLKIATVLLCAISGATASSVWAQQAAPAPAAKPAAAAPAPVKGFTPPASSSGQSIDSIAVVVNDDVITRNEVAARIKSVEQRM